MATSKKSQKASTDPVEKDSGAPKDKPELDLGFDTASARDEGEESTPYRALVVEDEALIRLDIIETLTDAGIEVVGEAADGAGAIERARELTPDVVVMDVKMPGMDGITAAEQILAERTCAVVMLTAFSQPISSRPWKSLFPVSKKSCRLRTRLRALRINLKLGSRWTAPRVC